MAINLDHVTQQLTVTDTAANASLTVNTKGTGAFNIAAGSGGLNLSNGGTVTAITRTVLGSYTSNPTVIISAPTTANGVQATATVSVQCTAATIASGGTGYTVGDTISMVGGTFTSVGTFRVATVSGGVITSVDTPNFASYTVTPSNPVSVTGGTGSGATLNVIYFIGTFTITNAGSGYVEQPTVSFSGGGSTGGGAAYAGIGGIATIKALASNVASLQLATAGGVAFSVADTNRTTVDYWEVIGSTGSVGLRVAGATTNNNGIITSKGTGYLSLQTNAFASEALRATHTASAVNYVQATGSATGQNVVISAQGSDSDVWATIQSKNNGGVVVKATGGFYAQNASGATQFLVANTASAVNYVQVTGNSTGSFPIVSGQGSDTNIGVNFSSKGAARFNFYSQGGVANRQFSVGGNGATAVNSIDVSGSTTGNAPVIQTQGSDTNIDLALTPKGTGGVSLNIGSAGKTTYFSYDSANNFQLVGATNTANLGIYATGGGSIRFYTATGLLEEQLRVAPTASAVNYVQVTGAATGNGATISSQGSDANIGLNLTTKGTFGGSFRNTAGSVVFGWEHSNTSTENYISVASNISTGAPVVLAKGTGTNIPLVLQPKGTGALQAQQTDSTATGGNARGANAVDWQTLRSVNSMVASGTGSVIVGGQNNTSSSYTSFVGAGANNYSIATNSFVGAGNANVVNVFGNYGAVVAGNSNSVNSSYGFIGGGQSNTSAGLYNVIAGGFTNSGTASAAVTTQSATTNATTAVTLSASNASIKVGQYVVGSSINTETYVAAVSGTSLTLSKNAANSSTSTLSFYTPHGVVVGGGNNTATGSYSFIGGGGDAGTAGNRNVASGDWSFVGGGRTNQATGIASFIGGGGVYTGSATTNFGHTASGPHSAIVGGLGNIASGESSFIGGGYGSITSGLYSTVGGGTTNYATGFGSTIAGGYFGTTRGIAGNMVSPACLAPISSGSGVSQSGLLILARQTTDATATVLCSDAGAASTTNQVILPNNSAYFFKGEVVSGVTGGGNTKGWKIEGLIKRGANAAATTLVGSTVTSPFGDAGAAGWVIAVTADTTNGGLAVTFTGQASTTIRTVCQVRTTEMTY